MILFRHVFCFRWYSREGWLNGRCRSEDKFPFSGGLFHILNSFPGTSWSPCDLLRLSVLETGQAASELARNSLAAGACRRLSGIKIPLFPCLQSKIKGHRSPAAGRASGFWIVVFGGQFHPLFCWSGVFFIPAKLGIDLLIVDFILTAIIATLVMVSHGGS